MLCNMFQKAQLLGGVILWKYLKCIMDNGLECTSRVVKVETESLDNNNKRGEFTDSL
jgi:hypothetical protein